MSNYQSYADNFDEALQGLYSDVKPRRPSDEPIPTDRTVAELASRASTAFGGYLQSLSDRDFDVANRHLKTLSSTLEGLTQRTSPSGDATTAADPDASDEIQR